MWEQGASKHGSKLVTIIGPSLHLPVGRAHGRRSAFLLSGSLLVYLPISCVPMPKAASQLWREVLARGLWCLRFTQ